VTVRVAREVLVGSMRRLRLGAFSMSQSLRFLVLLSSLASLASLAVVGCSSSSEEETPEASENAISNPGALPAGTVCHFDPASDQQNPWGMRTFLTLTKGEKTVTATWDELPSDLSTTSAAGEAIDGSIGQIRDMTFSTTDLGEVRRLLRTSPALMRKLSGDDVGFKEWERTMKCRPDDPGLPPGSGLPVKPSAPACAYDPARGAHPLGSSRVTIDDDGEAIHVSYEQSPSAVEGAGRIPVTIAVHWTLSLSSSLGIPKVRALLVDRSTGLAHTLLGDDFEAMSEVDAGLKCR